MARLGGTRVAAGVAVLLAALACTASPVQPTPSTRPTPEATPAPTPDINAPFPTTVLGLPVLTVDAASRLLFDGRLDGRVAAVSGYWMEAAIPMSCPWVPHAALLEGRCVEHAFADEHLHLATYEEYPDGSSSFTWSGGNTQGIGFLIPTFGPESVGGDLLGCCGDLPITPENDNQAQRIVLIGHAADARLWQCNPDGRDDCRAAFVVDRVVWVDGQSIDLKAPYSEADAALTLDAALAAANAVPEQALTAYPVLAEAIGDVDPRLVGVGEGPVWVVRSVPGAPNSDGTASATNVVVGDATAQILRTLPLATSEAYAPARLVITIGDQRTPSGGDWGYASYTVHDSAGRLIASNSGEPPLALAPGTYALHGFIDRAEGGRPPTASCDTQVELAALDDMYMTLDFAPDSTCAWAVGEPWP